MYRVRKGVKTALYDAIRSYGPGAFSVETILCMIPGAKACDLSNAERVIIAQDGTLLPGGYNMTEGGDGATNPFTSEKHRLINLGRKHTAATKRKMSVAHSGFRHSEESRQKISVSHKGKKHHWAAWRGKTLSDDHKAKMKSAWTPERRLAQAARMSALRRAPALALAA